MKTKFIVWAFAACCLLATFAVAVCVVFPLKHYDNVKKYSAEYGLDESYVLAVIWAESRFDENAVSRAGACGLMQLMPSTAEWLSGDNEEYSRSKLFEPDFNIMLGTRYIGYLRKNFEGDYITAAYNAGEGNVANWIERGGEIKFDETRKYIKKVNLAKAFYRFRIKMAKLI